MATPEEPPAIRLTETNEVPMVDETDETEAARTDDGSWSGVLSCAYRISHGWGNVYECTVDEVLDGTPPSGPLGLHLTVSDTRRYATDGMNIDAVVLRFMPSERPYGPPSGYRDGTGVYWVLSREE